MHATPTVTVSDSMHRTTDTPHQNISRLPKLNLPYFSGDPLVWQTFWDSFETRGLARRLADDPHLLQTYGKIISDHLK